MNTPVVMMVIALLVLLFMKVPVFASVLGASIVYFVMSPGINSAVFAQQAITGAESVTLLAIPFFVCAGVLMNYTGVTKRIMDFCSVLTGRMYGGLSQVNILLSTLGLVKYLPVVGHLNALLGAIVGILQGALLVWLLAVFLQGMLRLYPQGVWMFEPGVVENTWIFKYFANPELIKSLVS